jgi:hypothetical protein
VRSSARVAEILLVVALVGGGAWLCWHHLGTPSLWWDEFVQIRTAGWDTTDQVWHASRDGIVPGTGNAGAVPADYLLLHAWLATTSSPSPETLERYYRMPAFAYAVIALPLMWALARSVGGAAAGAVALALLATSLPHVLYAAEARPYSLSVLASLANAATFVALVRTPSGGRLALFSAVGVAYVLTSLYGIFPLAAEHLVLGVLALQAGARGRVVAIAASLLAVALVLYVWLGPAAITMSYGRGEQAAPPVLPAVRDTLLFFAGDVFAGYLPGLPAVSVAALLATVFGVALVAAPIVARRDRVAGALAAACLLSMCAVPVIVVIAHSKQYYYHPRHAIFLLPLVHLATALVLGRLLTRVMRAPVAAAVVGAVIVVGASATTVRAYLTDPLQYFRATKTLRDFRGLTRTIATRTAAQAPGEVYLLVLQLQRAGHLANPTLAFYLEAYGIADRVVLAGVSDPLPPLGELPRRCPDACRGPFDPARLATLRLRGPFDQPPLMRRLMRLRTSPWPVAMSGVGLVTWAPTLPPAPPGAVATPLDGLILFEPDPRLRLGSEADRE